MTHSFVSWIAPFIILYLTDAAGASYPIWLMAVLVLFGLPLLLAKLFVLVLMFQELLARKEPSWLAGLALFISLAILLLSIWSIKSYDDGNNMDRVCVFVFVCKITPLLHQNFSPLKRAQPSVS